MTPVAAVLAAAPWTAGALLAASALGKAVDVRFAAQAIEHHRWVPARRARPLMVGLSAGQAGLAVALLLGGGVVASMLAMALLLAGALAAVAAAWRDGLEDCGCHGRLLSLPPLWSAGLDGGLAAWLGAGVAAGAPPAAGWPAWAAAASVSRADAGQNRRPRDCNHSPSGRSRGQFV